MGSWIHYDERGIFVEFGELEGVLPHAHVPLFEVDGFICLYLPQLYWNEHV